ncbi:hypothetical protein [Salinibacter sp.]|uniref:hypothetical protein n=1 Tax=Salinibacter sp. TaxID=2065818 RepID=UPI0021E9070B|nr:hypothetical protein [Salinibacter sp.]
MSENIDPNEITLFAGLSGVDYAGNPVELSNGIRVSSTYAHLFSPRLVAFDKPESSGDPHPGPWEAAKGGQGYDIHVEVEVPESIKVGPFDHLNSVWWFAALLRLKGNTSVQVPAVSSRPFNEIPGLNERPSIWPIEESDTRVAYNPAENPEITSEDLEWIETHWKHAAELAAVEDFRTALEALDGSMRIADPNLALVMLWGGLERIFPPQRAGGFRRSAYLAAYLRPPGQKRLELQKEIKDLYGTRSHAAHGGRPDDYVPTARAHEILRKVLVKVVEEGEIPSRDRLEENLFVARDSQR